MPEEPWKFHTVAGSVSAPVLVWILVCRGESVVHHGPSLTLGSPSPTHVREALRILSPSTCTRLPHRFGGSCPRPRFPLISRTAERPQRTSRSAWYSTTGSIVSPRALAAFRLMTNSIFEFVSTGISAGFVPLRILSTRRAACLPEA